MNILIIANHYVVCSGRYYADAFKRAGHSVRSIGFAHDNKIWGMSLPPALAWQPEPPEDEWQPDLICYIDSDPAILNTVFEGAPRIVIGVDNHVRSYSRPYFNAYFLAHRNVSIDQWPQPVPKEGIWLQSAEYIHLPCAADPVIHTQSQIPYSEREYDVVCLGMMYPHRMQSVQELIAAGFKVKWGLGLIGADYAAAHHNARIALCLSFNGDVGQRVFEAASMENVVLTDNCKDFPLLKPDGFYVLDTGESVVATVKTILADPATPWRAITGRKWVEGHNHTWDARVKVVTDWFEANVPYEDRARVRV